jgi:hypothetical protein
MGELRKLGSPKPFIREGSAFNGPRLVSCLPGAGLISKAGPIKTDQDFFIVDAPFPQLLIASDVAAGKDGSGKDGVWEVQALAKAIKQIPGVLEVGIFHGLTGPEATKYGVKGGQRPVACYFGMQDGTVTVRKAPSKTPADLNSSP